MGTLSGRFFGSMFLCQKIANQLQEAKLHKLCSKNLKEVVEWLSLFGLSTIHIYLMKSKQFHQLIVRNGWELVRVKGSHYIYRKEGFRDMPIPYHGSKEMGPGLEKALRRDMKLK